MATQRDQSEVFQMSADRKCSTVSTCSTACGISKTSNSRENLLPLLSASDLVVLSVTTDYKSQLVTRK